MLFSTAGAVLKQAYLSLPTANLRMQEAESVIEAALRGGRHKSVAPSRQAITFQPVYVITSLNLKKIASRTGRKTETVGSINTVIQLSITAYMNLVCVCGVGGSQHGEALEVAANMEMRRTASEVRCVCDLGGKQSTKNLCQSINLEAVLQTHTRTHTHICSPPFSQKRVSAFTSTKRLQPPRILKGHFYLKMPPWELASHFMGKMDRF